VEARTSPSGEARLFALSERSDRCRVGLGRTDDTAGQARRKTARGRCSRGPERDLVRAFHRLPWQALPKDLPPKSTAHHYFLLWDWDGTLERIQVKAAQKGSLRSTRRAMMLARSSRVASVTSWSTRAVCC
jgi:transposase